MLINCNNILIAQITGVYLSLDEMFLPNGSNITYTEISTAQADSQNTHSLVCHTDKFGCCSEIEGNWYSANGSVITELSQEFSVIPDSNGRVTLFRDNELISLLSTLCCRVPDASNINQTVCVNSG